VAPNTPGVPGRAMLEALVQGTTDAESWPTWLAGRCARNFPPCGRPWVAASGSITAFLSPRSWRTSTALDEGIDTVSAQIEVAIAPFTEEVERLDTIPGVNRRTAEVIIAEIGVDTRSGSSICRPRRSGPKCSTRVRSPLFDPHDVPGAAEVRERRHHQLRHPAYHKQARVARDGAQSGLELGHHQTPGPSQVDLLLPLRAARPYPAWDDPGKRTQEGESTRLEVETRGRSPAGMVCKISQRSRSYAVSLSAAGL
jgi:hypothetical protein